MAKRCCLASRLAVSQATNGMAVQHNSAVYIDPHDALTALLSHMASWHLLPLGEEDDDDEEEEEVVELDPDFPSPSSVN